MKWIFRKNKCVLPGTVGLALGSGSARGWAHIGVIRALTEAGIRVDYVAGTSIGALVGAVYTSGEIETLEEVVLQLDWKQIAYFFDVVLPKSGLIDGKKVSTFIRSHLKGINIEELPIPFCAVATDLGTGNEVVLKQGDIIEAIRASISVPGIFTPVKRNGNILVDGGLVNPVPVSVVREMGADFVIAVDLNHNIVGGKGFRQASAPILSVSQSGREGGQVTEKKNKILEVLNNRIASVDFPALSQIREWMGTEQLPNIFEVLISSINIMEAQITATKLKTDPPELLIQPNLGHLKFLEFNRAKEAIAEGYMETKARLDRISGKGG
ncbi:MAG: patatin-like phospholipase family protein [Thermodesulfobacteriota bacterium]|nr:patatin-like phospholipase family protein [Thermodesulfobacteriota bacterium]